MLFILIMPTVLMNKKSHPLTENIYQNQSKQFKNNRAHGGVWLDKKGTPSDRTASGEPASDLETSDRTGPGTKHPRVQNASDRPRPKVPFTLHVDPILKADVQRLAALNTSNTNDSASAEGAALLEAKVREQLHREQAATLDRTIERSIAKASRSFASRMAFLLVWIIYDVGDMKALASNTLGMQQGATPELLTDILKQAKRTTQAALARKRPELSPLVAAVEEWLVAEDQEEGQAKTPPIPAPGVSGKRGRGGGSL
jgi:hypothetical protein